LTSLFGNFKDYCSVSDIRRFTKLTKKGNVAINSVELFVNWIDKIEKHHKILDVLNGLSYVASNSAENNHKKRPHTGSLNNCMGRWFELIFFKEFNDLLKNHALAKGDISEILKLPSANKNHKFCDLFVAHERHELFKIKPSTSNPDFIILKNSSQPIYPKGLSLMEKYRYYGYFGKLQMNDIDTIISIKTSARPDRRYQQVYEANLIKAIFERFNLSVKFIAITLHENKKNEEVYYSTSIISIIKDKENFRPSIDKSIILDKVNDVENVFKYIFNT